MSVRRLAQQEIVDCGTAIYLSKLRPLLEPALTCQFVAIDVETEEYEVATDPDAASDQLWKRQPDAQILVEKIGYSSVFYTL